MLETTEPTSCTTPASFSLLTPPRSGAACQRENESAPEQKKKRKSSQVNLWTEEKQERSNKICAIWIGGSNLPVSAVEDPNMKNYIESLNPDATLPSRQTLQRQILTVAEKITLKMKEALLTARRVSVTTDIWSAHLSTDSYIGVTVHIINVATRKRQCLKISKFSQCSFKNHLPLSHSGCEKFNQEHTGVNIAEILYKIFQRFGIESKVWFVLTDSGANMIKGIISLQVRYFFLKCLYHSSPRYE